MVGIEQQTPYPSPYLLGLRDVPGRADGHLGRGTVGGAAGARPGDVDWPQPDEVFVSVTPPEGGDESLTLAESARLDRMDADIAAVIAREYEQSLPTTEVDLPRWSAPRCSCARPAIRRLWPRPRPADAPCDARRRSAGNGLPRVGRRLSRATVAHPRLGPGR